jgi:alanyl-tRNA synthetase
MKVAEIRSKFLEYFQSKNHKILPSSSLIPVGDPTLLFTTAGMVQFKPYFTGAVEISFRTAATSQKCLRTSDLENVGRTERHCTFFEMLGNFSFGDYFKKEAIEYALDFSTNHLGFPKDKIWITVYLDDDEAVEMWQKVGIPSERIVRLGKSDNFWGPAGDTGACGPCSELYLDRGVEKGWEGCGKKETCKPGCNCDRFLEFWNLVFNQFDQDINGVLNPLKQTGIDTGSGLERVALLLQKVDSVYDTDELKRIISFIEKLSGVSYDSQTKVAFRVITDHSRATTFAIADGVIPDKTGRGYVIRRLIRRASLFARRIGLKKSFLHLIVPELIDIYSKEYKELLNKKDSIIDIIKKEEELFIHTLELGLNVLENKLKKYKSENKKVFSGVDSFQMYGTYGFPKEMTKEIILENGLEFDEDGFEKELEKDRELSRESWKGKKLSVFNLLDSPSKTNFTGYDKLNDQGKILFLVNSEKLVEELKEGEEGVIVLDQTNFYAESGGQIGDSGFIKKEGSIFKVNDTQKENDVYFHIGKVLSGNFKLNDSVLTEIELKKREYLTYHHSGTHLLHGALREILGSHVSQKASLVSDEYLRFDFSHKSQMSEDELNKVEEKINSAIRDSILVDTKVLGIEEAKKTGAVAFFEEKYGDEVRVIKMGNYSIEFCGGTHVSKTSDISYFYIVKESSPGAGNRRIEAVCGDKVVEFLQKEFQILTTKVQDYNLKSKDIYQDTKNFIQTVIPDPTQVEKDLLNKGSLVIPEFRNLKKQVESELKTKNEDLLKFKKQIEQKENEKILTKAEEIFTKSIQINDLNLVIETFHSVKIEVLKELADRIKNRNSKLILCFLNQNTDSTTVLFVTNKFSLEKGVDLKTLFATLQNEFAIKGGGKPDLIQGSFDSSKQNEFVSKLESIIKG